MKKAQAINFYRWLCLCRDGLLNRWKEGTSPVDTVQRDVIQCSQVLAIAQQLSRIADALEEMAWGEKENE